MDFFKNMLFVFGCLQMLLFKILSIKLLPSKIFFFQTKQKIILSKISIIQVLKTYDILNSWQDIM